MTLIASVFGGAVGNGNAVDDSVGSDTPKGSRSPCALSAALILVLKASPLPKLEAISFTRAASDSWILVSTWMAADEREGAEEEEGEEPARRPSVMDIISTWSAVVPAALEMATLYEDCFARSNSFLVYGRVALKVTKIVVVGVVATGSVAGVPVVEIVEAHFVPVPGPRPPEDQPELQTV